MSNQLFIKANQLMKKKRPFLPVDRVCQVFRANDLLEISFLSKQCRNDLAGSCIMCDYGCASGTCEDAEYIDEMRRILTEYNGSFDCLLLCTNGSIMDESQVSSSLFEAILNEAGRYDFPKIEIETHYRNVTCGKLETIRQALPHKQITIEMGLETIDSRLQESIIMKHIDIDAFDGTVSLIKQYGFDVELNIMLGIPFLSAKEQLEDTRRTVHWALERNCGVVIFPINIKPFTLLWHMHHSKHYNPISHWLMVLLLDSIPADKLNRVTAAWFGNREEVYEQTDERAIFPTSCATCHPTLMSFYGAFNKAAQSRERKELIIDALENNGCACLEKQFLQLNQSQEASFDDKYNAYAEVLLRDFTAGEATRRE